jgi:DNA-binding beta-propeller fold protein YncE
VKKCLILSAIALLAALQAPAQSAAPLEFIQNIDMPGVPVGPYTDHLAVDVPGRRLFATPQAHKSVYVFDLNTGKLIHDFGGMGNPHSILYRSDLDRIYITDAEPGLLRIFSGKDYRAIKTLKLLADADSIGYDPATKNLYIGNGGEGANLPYALISIVDTTTGEHSGDIKIAAQALQAMALESSGPRMYVDLMDKNEIGVVDREKRALVDTWPVTKGRQNIAIALDEQHHRLFVGCRDTDMSGTIVVFDTQTGKETGTTIPIGGWVDYMAYDPPSGRLYASCGVGYVYVFQERTPDQYDLIGQFQTAVMAKTGLFVPELKRFFVSVPHIDGTLAKVLVFQVR